MDALPPGLDLCQIPAGAPPDGTPNFRNPRSLAPAWIGVTVIMMTWTVIFLAGRLWINKRRLQLADMCAIVALITSAAYSGNILAMRNYMRHQWDMPTCWFDATYFKLSFSMQILNPLAHSFSKASILLLLLQVFSVSKKMRIAIYTGLVGIVLIYGPYLILGPVYTVPYAGETWEDLLTNGRPQQLNKVMIEQAVLATVIDLYIFALPFPMLSSLNLGLHKRLQLTFVFGTALMGVIASVTGLAVRVPVMTTEDITWMEARVFICIAVELYIAIIVSCMPAFANFTRRHISESGFYKSLTSLLWSPKGNGSGELSPQENWRAITTFGGTKPPKAVKKMKKMKNDNPQLSEFHDTSGLYSPWTSRSMNEVCVATLGETRDQETEILDPGITRTYCINQSFGPREMELTEQSQIQHAHNVV
ncbi:hypothetical protein F4810DRAFT_706720 [Camillea tinctor]|nr:hypothetical protein F4810DRAFT_706720 [Camillea tinctor]